MFDIVVKNKSNVVKRGVHSYRQRYASSLWSKFIADNILTTVMTRIVVDKSAYHLSHATRHNIRMVQYIYYVV